MGVLVPDERLPLGTLAHVVVILNSLFGQQRTLQRLKLVQRQHSAAAAAAAAAATAEPAGEGTAREECLHINDAFVQGDEHHAELL